MKLRITVYSILTIFGIFIMGAPKHAEFLINYFFTYFKISLVDVTYNQTLLSASLGVMLFIISCIGVFEQHKISLGYINAFNKQINILHQFANHAGVFILLLIIILISNFYFKNEVTQKQILTITYDIMIICYLFLLFIVVKSLIFEPIADNFRVSKRLDDFGYDDTTDFLLT